MYVGMIVIRNFRNTMHRLVFVYAALSNPRYRTGVPSYWTSPLSHSRQGVDIRDSTLPLLCSSKNMSRQDNSPARRIRISPAKYVPGCHASVPGRFERGE